MESLERATVSQLKKLCYNMGISGTGKKSEIAFKIREELLKPDSNSTFTRIPNSKVNFNILSIDMGIRNFSLNIIQLDKNLPFNRPPLVKEWVKFDLNAWGSLDSKDGFEPSLYAPVCNHLVNEILLNKNKPVPDVILIERQRARSMGSSNVIEWVFRVNMLESMLHGILYSKLVGLDTKTDIISTSAKRMGNYWKLEDDKGKKIKNNDTKKFRIQLVDHWLKESILNNKAAEFKLDLDKFAINKESLDKISKIRSKTKWINQIILGQSEFIDSIYKESNLDKNSATQKGDDLVDSLLHSLAWYEWERNKMILHLEFRNSLAAVLELSDKLYDSHKKKLKQVQ